MKKGLLLLLLSTAMASMLHAQQPDSIYFYKNGAILYSEAVNQIDSLTFQAANYYDLQRSDAIFQEIQSHAELSIFSEIILKTGYKPSLINKTIWAPTNQYLKNLDLSDSTLVLRTLYNQLSNVKYTTGDMVNDTLSVKMESGKRFILTKTGNTYALDGKTVTNSNIKVASSVIHIVNGLNPFPPDIGEYIEKTPGLDSVRAYIQSLTKTVVARNVYVNGVFRDSFPYPQNDVWDYLADIGYDDGAYTAVLPDNQAFINAYNRLYPMCKTPAGATAQSDLTKWLILRESFFRGRLKTPLNESILQSVSGTEYLPSDSLWSDVSSSATLTNGTVYVVRNLRQFDPKILNRDIRIEAEDFQKNGIRVYNGNPSSLTNNQSDVSISNNQYLWAKSTSSSSLLPLSVSIPIPNTFSRKYQIEVVFVPGSLTDSTDQRPYKFDGFISFNPNQTTSIPTYTKLTLPTNTNNSKTLTNILFAEKYDFPKCDIEHKVSPLPNVFIRIKNTVLTSETTSYSRDLRIDYVLLKPVE